MTVTPPNMIDLSGKVALLPGGAGAIGSGIAKVLMDCGARVVVSDVKPGLAERKAKALGGDALGFTSDVSSAAQCQELVDNVVAACGTVDILVYCATVPPSFDGPLDMSIEAWERSIDVGLRGAYLMCRNAGRVMVEQGSGNIFFLSAVSVYRAFGPGDVSYTSTKAAFHAMTQMLTVHWARSNVRVNSIAIGYVDAGIAAKETRPGNAPGGDEESLLATIPSGRAGTPEDIGWPIAFIASDLGSYINGTVLAVDGGMLAL